MTVVLGEGGSGGALGIGVADRVLMLENAYYTVLEACDADSGVEAACREHPDLILLDVSMPNPGDGFEAASMLAGSRCRSHIFAPRHTHHYAFIIHPLFWFGTRGIYNFYLLQRPTI